ncbi:MAG: hypothetical protein ABIG44_18280 [Planctomycetota bacterium]
MLRMAIGLGIAAISLAVMTAANDYPVPVDMTNEAVATHGVGQAVIIDTRLFDPQIQANEIWSGPSTPIKNYLPLHSHDAQQRTGEVDNLPLGGLHGEVRSSALTYFPGIQATPWTPPDPTIAVGPNHIVETVNMSIAFYTKEGDLQFSQYLDSSGNPGFFEEVGGGSFTFDPKCFYDHYAERFVVLALEVYSPTESWITIAVSDDSDPNGVWYKYRTWSAVEVSGQEYWVDYPGLGFDHQAYYVTGNLFRQGGGGIAGVLFRIFDKTQMLVGEPVEYSDLRKADVFSVQVAHCHGTAAMPYFVAVEGATAINIMGIMSPLGAPSIITATVNVPPFAFPSFGAPNLGGAEISTLDGRIINAHWRRGNLYVAHGIRYLERNLARWYHFDTGYWPMGPLPSLVQSGNIDPGGNAHTYFPAIYSSARDAVGMVLAQSSPNEYASIQVTGREPDDPPGTLGPLTQVHIGTGGYTSFRWGDYFDITIDPVDDNRFWFVGEYATASDTWNTWIGSFIVSYAFGDMNCDGDINAYDIDGFICALSPACDYDTLYPDCQHELADINQDGEANAYDIDPFIDRLGDV